jgi:adenylate cyclase
VDDLEGLLLGAPPTLTREEVEARSGVPAERAYDVWAAMGFAEVPYGQQAFTEADVAALRTASELIDLGIADQDTILVMARAMGQAMARLAEAQLGVLRGMTVGLDLEQSIQALSEVAPVVLPKIDQLVLFVWRRQFAAAVQRSLVTAREDGMPVVAVGFLDIVNFTRASREWDAAQLERTLEGFERSTALRVAAVGGRVVKTLGDGVLYTTDSAGDALEVALQTVEAHEADPTYPSVRGGLALGSVLVRLGDVFGEPVNIAARLAEEARPGSVLVDRHVVEDASDRFDFRPLARRSVRGYRSLAPYLARRR